MSSVKQQREYYKILTGLEQNEGGGDLNLFYNASTVETVLYKDSVTPLHYSFFADKLLFNNSGLVEAGAIAGPVPAVADRIYSSQRGYGDRTYWDETSFPQNGGWFYSWLYDNNGDKPIWMDRYYTPGSLSAQSNIINEYNKSVYLTGSNTFFVDVTSTRTFEPKGYYEYVHIGDKTYKEQINQLSGVELSGLGLHFSTWSEGAEDRSPYNNLLRITGSTENALNSIDESISDTAFLNLSTTDDVDYRIDHNESYLTNRHFTVMLWLKCENWDSINTSQILGNIGNGGYGVFYESYKHTPYMVFGDSKRSILFYINNNFENYETVNILSSYNVKLDYYAVDSKSKVFVLDNVSKKITKFDHTGNSPIAQITLTNVTSAIKIFFDLNDDLYVTTNSEILKIDNGLIEIVSRTPHVCNEHTFIVFTDESTYQIFENVKDVKIVDTNIWKIDTVNTLTVNNSAVDLNYVTCIEVDPDEYVWCLHDFNKISKLDNNGTPIFTRKVEPENTNTTANKRLAVVRRYIRSTQKHIWYMCVLTNTNRNIYQVSMDGNVSQNIHLPYQIGHLTDNILDEEIQLITSYNITSHTTNRIRAKAYKSRIEFRLNMKKFILGTQDTIRDSTNSTTNQFKDFYTSISRDRLINGKWHHLCFIFNDNTITSYLDTKLVNTLTIDQEYIVSFEGVNSYHIGDFSGRFGSLSDEIKEKNFTFNGCLDELRVYRYCIEPWFLVLFRRAYIKTKHLIWNMPTSKVHNTESIKAIFKNKLPGSFSNYFNLKITGIDLSKLTDEEANKVKEILEEYIRTTIDGIKPATSDLLNIEWS